MDIIEVISAIIIKDQKLLITKRQHKDQLGDKWELTGGKKEKNESLKDCLKRELEEEFSIDAVISEHLTQSNYEYPHIKINLANREICNLYRGSL